MWLYYLNSRLKICVNMCDRDIFIITSVINTGNRPWSYTSQRSIYTPQERFVQTLESIQSIRLYAPSSLIILTECSDISEYMMSELQIYADVVIQLNQDPQIRHACLESPIKGLGELWKLLAAIDYIQNNHIQFRRLFKLSARYSLTERFDISAFSDTAFGFMFGNPPEACTILYSVPHTLLATYIQALKNCISIFNTHRVSLECILPENCVPHSTVRVLGITGQIAIDHSQVNA